MTLTVKIPASAFTCQVTSAEEIAEGPDPTVPELEVLKHYFGQWDSEITGKPAWKRTESGEWVLNGRFLRQCWSTEAGEGIPKASGITIMTFDVKKKAYLSWSFLAIGSVACNEGVWDSASRTMTWRDRLADTGEAVVTKATFVDEGTNVWSIAETDREGKIVREVAGKNTRRFME
ncbi:MAG: hypothetical protein QOE70_1255 [Chthoniobacter sp.]|nr:hypothetical protein [Chthoniobacter sp.]